MLNSFLFKVLYPSGKGLVCKTIMRWFESNQHLSASEEIPGLFLYSVIPAITSR